jgi:hypothetical protein
LSGLEIAKFTEYFNIVAVCAVAVFAVLGVLSIISERANLKAFRPGIFAKAFCFASIIAFAAEATVFNFQRYLKFFAGPELRVTGVSPDSSNIILTSDDNVRGEIKAINNDGWSYLDITFKGLNMEVTSAFVDVAYKDSAENTFIRIMWTDEESTRDYGKTLYKYRPFENHVLVQSCGKVSEISMLLRGNLPGAPPPDLIAFSVNQTIPFYFSGLRLLAVSLIFFALIIFFHKKLRAKASYYLFEYRFDPANRKQNVVYAVTVFLLMAFSLACIYTSSSNSRIGRVLMQGPQPDLYNKHLVDALIAGRTWIDYGSPEKLLEAERPYDIKWLAENGYEFMLDWSWYKGKYYSYFGVVPAAMLYVPYKLITGDYLSYFAGLSLFALIAVGLMAALWRFCVMKYMPGARFAFYLIAFLALFFASGLFCLLRFPAVYSVVQMSALMFVIAGILLLLKSVEHGDNINKLKLFFACLCFALAVGCRPTMIFASLLVPAALWKYRSWKLLLFAMIPYIMVAVPLCVYNYVRFESIADFGHGKCIAANDLTAYQLLNPIGKAIRIIVCSLQYLFLPLTYSLYFPFVDYIPQHYDTEGIRLGSFLYVADGGGIVNFPIVLCLFYLFKNIFRKNNPPGFHILPVFLIIAALLMLATSYTVGFINRALPDYAFFIILSSLFCAFYWCDEKHSVHLPRIRMKITYVLLGVSILIGLFLSVAGESLVAGQGRVFATCDPVMYRYLEYSLGILRRI